MYIILSKNSQSAKTGSIYIMRDFFKILKIFEKLRPYTINQRRAYLDDMTKATSVTAKCTYIEGL